jgi:alpha-tubulin suppressor-like RCC1 family protein
VFHFDFTATRDRLEPTLLDTNTTDGTKLEWTQIVCGRYYTVGLTKMGEVFTWGLNDWGQLGHGDWNERTIPTKVAALAGLVVIKISCGSIHIAALTDKGEILTWYVPVR